ncbi:MAG: type IV pilus modification protein PilV [Azonexus sp.]|uniref:type IV pilus modification protein PilV n=1 Tax=Azonexus sp. TaxID=1872668 RepID=UPI002826D187|nr:type IV pilus modification protein PilV [Azonexus sp.]MDR0775520.1 type IV pilus modification protein PilV [Azonexus sp.]
MKKIILPSRCKQRGVSLLEVLIAVLILSFGLLGLASLQMTTLRNNQSSFERSRAIMAIYSIADSLRADPATADGTLETSAGTAAAIIGTWKESLIQHYLGSDADGSVDCKSEIIEPPAFDPITTYICTITVTWNDSLGGMQGAQGSDTHTMTMEVPL